ncbi:MAG: tyrosine-type recombinase/integrase [Pseudomonadales bacterium]|nr:tyrosine-type recombinase/integrase [Pseudomonadales bacterium]
MGTIVARKNAKGEIRYRAQVRVMRGGKRLRAESRTFSRKQLAKEWIRRREAELEVGGDAELPEGADMSLREGIHIYLAAVGHNFGRSKNAALRALAEMPIAEKRVIDLVPRDFIEHVHWRRSQPPTQFHPRGVGPATLNGDLIFLRLVVRYLQHAYGLPISVTVVAEAVDALRAVRLIDKGDQRERRPEADELRSLDAYLFGRWRSGRMSVPMWHLMWLAIYSGRRRDELSRIPRRGLDRAHGVYVIEGGIKNPAGRVDRDVEAVLPAAGWAVVERILADFPGDDGPLLEFNPKSAGTRWKNACNSLEIADLRFHDLRHEALSRLGEDGLTVPQIQQVSLHQSWDSLRRYVNMPARRGERVEFMDSVGVKGEL